MVCERKKPLTRPATAGESAVAGHPLPKGEGYISDLGTLGVQPKMWDTLSPGGEGKDPIPCVSPRERNRRQRWDRCVQREMWDTLNSPKGERRELIRFLPPSPLGAEGGPVQLCGRTGCGGCSATNAMVIS